MDADTTLRRENMMITFTLDSISEVRYVVFTMYVLR